MTKKANEIIGVLGSYISGIWTVAQDVTSFAVWLVGSIPIVVGAILTYQIARNRAAEAEEKRIRNEILKIELSRAKIQHENELKINIDTDV